MGRHAAEHDRALGTIDDFAMLRGDGVLRWRCLAAGVLPLIVYSVVLVLLGDVRLWATLLVLPVTLGGVSVGALLDAAHKHSST